MKLLRIQQCEAVISLVFVYGIISLACANFLVLLRVISLWDRNAVRAHSCIAVLLKLLIAILRR